MRTPRLRSRWRWAAPALWGLLIAHPPSASAILDASFDDCAPSAPSIVLAQLRRGPGGQLRYVVVRTLKGRPPASGVVETADPAASEGRLSYFLLDARGRLLHAPDADGCACGATVTDGRVASDAFPSGSASQADFEQLILHPEVRKKKLQAALQECLKHPAAPCPQLPKKQRTEAEGEYILRTLRSTLNDALQSCGFDSGELTVWAPLLPGGEIQGVRVQAGFTSWRDPTTGPTCIAQALEKLRFRPYDGHPLQYPLFVKRPVGGKPPPRKQTAAQ